MAQEAYSQTFNQNSNTGNFAYALTIPGTAVVAGGAFARVKFAPTLSIKDAYIGHKGAGPADFNGSQAQLFKGGGGSFGDGWTDPIAITITAGQPLVVRLDATSAAGQNYPFRTGQSGHQLRYKSGQGGASNGDSSLSSGFTTLDGRAAMIKCIEVAPTLADFDDEDGNVTCIDALTALEDRGLSHRLAAAGQGFPAASGQRNCFSLQVAGDKSAIAFVDMIELTLDADSEVTLRAFTAPQGATVFNSHCNTNFIPGAPGPNARVRRWLTANDPNTLGGRHTSYLLKANKKHIMYAPRGFLGIIHPGMQGLAVIVHEPNVAAHVAWEWHERPT